MNDYKMHIYAVYSCIAHTHITFFWIEYLLLFDFIFTSQMTLIAELIFIASARLCRSSWKEYFLQYLLEYFLEYLLEYFLEYFLEYLLEYFLEYLLEYFLEYLLEYFL